MTDALRTSGPIVFITAAGGALANIVGVTGVGKILAESLAASPIPVFLIPFLITGLSKFAQGSASVAGIMAAGLTLPLCETGLLSPCRRFFPSVLALLWGPMSIIALLGFLVNSWAMISEQP